MCGWLSLPASAASLRNMLLYIAASALPFRASGNATLTATLRLAKGSSARYTLRVAPRPSSRISWYLPTDCIVAIAPLPVPDGDRLERREAEQTRPALLAPVAALLHAAERQLDSAAGAVIVDEHLPRLQRLRKAHLASAVARPHAGDQAVLRRVGERDGFRLGVERHRHQHGAEDLLLRERMQGRDVGEQ